MRVRSSSARVAPYPNSGGATADLTISSDSEDEYGMPTTPLAKMVGHLALSSGGDTDLEEYSSSSASPYQFNVSSKPSPAYRKSGLALQITAGVAERAPRELLLSAGGGITCTSIPTFLAMPELGGSADGVLIEAVKAESPAAEAGLRVGDVLLSVNGEYVREHVQAVKLLVEATAAGREVVLCVHSTSLHRRFDKEAGKLGVTLEHILSSSEDAARSGVIVAGLRADSMCKPAGLCVGHLLLSVNDVLVDTHQHAVQLIDAAERHVDLVYRDNLTILSLRVGHGARETFALHDAPLGVGAMLDVVSGTDAFASGLEVGDVIVSINDELVRAIPHAHQHPSPLLVGFAHTDSGPHSLHARRCDQRDGRKSCLRTRGSTRCVCSSTREKQQPPAPSKKAFFVQALCMRVFSERSCFRLC